MGEKPRGPEKAGEPENIDKSVINYNMENVEVLTVDPEMFKAVMSIVVRDSYGKYRIFLKDLCELLQLDVKVANDYAATNYAVNRLQEVPHLEMQRVTSRDECLYVESGETYRYTDDDVYYVADLLSQRALVFLLLDMVQNRKFATKFEEKFAVVLGMTIEDCFKYAPEFEKR